MGGILDGRVALVTGASRGIGYFTAIELAKAGAHVIACARTTGGLEELDDAIRRETGEGATLVPFDLADMNAIDALGQAIHDRWGKLDVMVANAGILGVISPIGHVEAKVFEKVMLLNVTATWRLIRSVEPLMSKSDAGVRLSCPRARPIAAVHSGAPTLPPRRLSKRWRGHGPASSRTSRCVSTPSIRVRRARPCARRPCRAKTRIRCRIHPMSPRRSCR